MCNYSRCAPPPREILEDIRSLCRCAFLQFFEEFFGQCRQQLLHFYVESLPGFVGYCCGIFLQEISKGRSHVS